MSAPQIHLMLNHLPVIGMLFVVVALTVGMVFRAQAILRLSLALLPVLALVAVPVFLSGEPAEEAIEHAAGVSERVIEPHEAAARAALIGIAVLGVVGLVGLLRWRRSRLSMRFAGTLLVASVALSGWLAWTAHLGGQIRHPELRPGVQATSNQAEQANEQESEREEDSD